MDTAMTGTDPREETIRDIVAREAHIDRSLLVNEATIEQLGIASIDLTLAVFELEKRFDIEIPVVAANEGAEFRTVGDLIGHVIAVLDRRQKLAPEAIGRGAA
jgi:acyl carrier protein